MKRRTFIAGLGSAGAWPVVARAQQPDRIRRVGILSDGSEIGPLYSDKAFLEGLAQLGWMEGRNLRIDYRLASSNDPDVMRPHAEALVRAGAGRHFCKARYSGAGSPTADPHDPDRVRS